MGAQSLNLLTGISKTIFITSTERYLDCHANTLQWVASPIIHWPILNDVCHLNRARIY